MATRTAEITLVELEPGTHISCRTIRRIESKQFTLDAAACREPRPDWGCYSPVETLPALERALRAAGAFASFGPITSRQLEFRFGFVN